MAKQAATYKAYRAYYHDAQEGCIQFWSGSYGRAVRWLRESRPPAGEETGPSGVEEVRLPKTLAGLAHWLNVHFNRDNG